MTRRILIWGNTPLAGWLAASLHAHHTVYWITDENTQAEFDAHGGIYLAGASSPLRSPRPVTKYADVPEHDLILLAVPGWATASLMMEMRAAVEWGTRPPQIVLLQNGVGGLERVKSTFGEDCDPLTVVFTRPFWNTSYHHGQPVRTFIATHESGGAAVQSDHQSGEFVAGILRQAGLQVMLGAGDSLQWSSVFWSIQGNAISAVLDVTPQAVYKDRVLRAYEHVQLKEALRVIDEIGVNLVRLPGVNVPRLANLVRYAPRALEMLAISTSLRPPSLREELRSGVGHSDAAYLNGAVAVKGHDLGLRTPINHALALLVTDIAEGRAGWTQYRQNPEMLLTAFRVAMS